MNLADVLTLTQRVTPVFHSSCLEFTAGQLGGAANPGTLGVEGGGLEQQQWSNELRYFGRFGDVVDVTTGLYYFHQDISNGEARSLFGGAVRQTGGGSQEQDVYGVFLNLDADVTDSLTITMGGRFTREEKSVAVTSLQAPKPARTINGVIVNGFCAFNLGECPIDFTDSDAWQSVDFKLGFQYEISPTARIYGHWSTGSRAGGYNVRNSRLTDIPGPVDPERVNNFEIGLKSEPLDRVRFNLAAFYAQNSDLQRTVIFNDPATNAVIQTRANTADATIWGIEADVQARLTDTLYFAGSFGYINAEYDEILFDISGDGIVDATDLALEIPRTPEITFSASLVHDLDLGGGNLNSRIAFSYVDSQFAADNNGAFLNSRESLDFNISYKPNDSFWEIAVFGKNVLNDVHYTSDLQLPASVGSSFSTLKKGRQFGLSAKLRFE